MIYLMHFVQIVFILWAVSSIFKPGHLWMSGFILVIAATHSYIYSSWVALIVGYPLSFVASLAISFLDHELSHTTSHTDDTEEEKPA
jgi:hypothetical protein